MNYFEFNDNEINLILYALGELPAKQSYDIISNIHKQYDNNNNNNNKGDS